MTDAESDPPVDHVVDGVYISGWRATLYADQLRANHLLWVLKLYMDQPYFPPDFITLENSLNDGEFIPLSVLRRGVDFIVKQVDAGNKVLVMCGAGISRSSTFVLAYMLERNYDLRQAFQTLRLTHPIATPHFQMWLSLLAHYHLPYTLTDIFDWMRREE
ncbi:MAG TPA: dual specificity protein phosphatase [Aggregatilineaceae bacterium]|nr:dual specificity protein phosphatase [Aggregatilineaceae bacterium]